ncbi:MAG TPA: MOSC N-terminal beta barrel domain-containing protein [Gemmatimonadales bacterium]|nr:MOSC N-terminal beta barrel domain-containing protein [Gemmatimonadales bacterium]
MHISSLHRYPIKGCRGHSLERAEFDEVGVVGDRRLMLVDADNRFISQREMPVLATIDPLLDGPMLTVRVAGRQPFSHELTVDGASRMVTIWGDTVPAIDQGDIAAEWFSSVTGAPVRLVRWTPDTHRKVDPKYSPRDTAEATFTDAYPALGVTEASLADLNRRLAEPVPMARFRPTMVIGGGDAWDEDEWSAISAGSMTFDAVKPCARCVVTTTDQSSGARNPHQEPLRTLATFRTIKGLGAIFGQNLVHRAVGAIVVGDVVEPA